MSDDTRFRVNRPEVIDEKFEDEFVIVNLKSGAYYGLRQVGAEIWRLVVEGASLAEMNAYLAAHFDAPLDVIQQAIETLTAELVAEELITATTETVNASNALPTEQAQRLPFTAPILEKFTDMQQVLMLDPIHEVDESGWPARKS